MFTTSFAFQPLGSCTNARLSELLLLFDSARREGDAPTTSDRFRGRPLSMILPDSDWCLLCPRATPGVGSLSSDMGETEGSGLQSLGVSGTAWFAGLSHGLGDCRVSIGADTGVGNVEAVMAEVAADLGVVNAAESGVNGVREWGESSVLAERMGASTGVPQDRSRVSDICRVRRGTAELVGGITSGVRLFGDSGCRASFSGFAGDE
jgi:hypothetical protein